MKKSWFSFCFFALSLSNAMAQIDSIKALNRHELGTFTGGTAATLVTGDFSQFSAKPLGLTYKLVKGKWATRFGYEFQSNRSVPPAAFAHRPLPNGDIETLSHDGYSRHHIFRVGKEYRIPLKRNIQFVIGADLQCRNVLLVSQWGSVVAKIDTVLNPGTSTQQIVYNEINHRNLERTDLQGWQYGLGLSVGFLFPLGKRCWLSSNLRLDSFYGSYTENYSGKSGLNTNRNRGYFAEANVRSFLSELAVFYRF